MIPYCSEEIETQAKYLLEPALDDLELPAHVQEAIEHYLEEDEYIHALQAALYYH